MTCDCHDTEAQHEADEQTEKIKALKLAGTVAHCTECIREARGHLAAEMCRLCPPEQHRICEYHR